MGFTTIAAAFAEMDDFNLASFGEILKPLIDQALAEHKKDKCRQGTLLVPRLLVWLVLALTLRRDLSYPRVLNWLVSGFRWIKNLLPAKAKLVQDGTISHARVSLGKAVFQTLFIKLVASFAKIVPDFHGLISVAFDGSTGTMPDTESNTAEFHKPKSGRGTAAFPQLRMMTLMVLSVRLLLDIAYAPYCGKGTGERTLLLKILDRLGRLGLGKLVFLLDAGLYSFEILWKISEKKQKFIVKAPRSAKLTPIEKLSDGSFLAVLVHKVLDLDAPKTKSGRRRWKTVTLKVRVIPIQIPGFRPFSLVTNILDPDITAREIALHYHKRWDIEIGYDEIKTHQCATLRGQSPTTFRSKRPDLVEQELYALLIMYNSVRLLIYQAAVKQGKDPCSISFLDALQHIIDAAPIMTAIDAEQAKDKFNYLLALIADCDIDRPRRHRLNPRVVKVKMSKFKRKNKDHKCEHRNIEKELKIIFDCPGVTQTLESESPLLT
jgi:hypothetical protein